MIDGTGLVEFAQKFPERTFDVGIAEEHALTFACGLAAEGIKPYFAVYSTFLQRAYDNILHDMALQNLPVKICIDRAGLNYSDGPTHHGIFDVAMLSALPNLTFYAPTTYDTLRLALNEMNVINAPCAVRYSKGEEIEKIKNEFYREAPTSLSVKANFDDTNELDALIITHGSIALEAIKAKEALALQGKKVGIVLVERIMPYASLVDDLLKVITNNPIKIITLEEEIRTGGFGVTLLDKLSSFDIMKNNIGF